MNNFVKNLLGIVVGTLLAYLFVQYVATLLTPFIVAVFLAFFVEPLVVRLQGKGMSRGAAVSTTMLVLFGGSGLMISLAITRLIIELVHLTTYLPYYIENIKTVISSMQDKVMAYYFSLPKDVIDFIGTRVSKSSGTSLESLLSKVQTVTTSVLNVVLSLVTSVPAWIILIIISAIATYFISKDKKELIGMWLKAVPKPWGSQSLEIVKEVFHAIIGYMRAQLILISITLVQSLLGLYIIGAPYALIMGLVIGLADLVPVLGPSAIYIPWIVWSFVVGNTVFAIKLLVLYAVVLVVRQVLETKIVASSMGLHPLLTLMAMYIGLKLLGPLGVIVGPLYIITLKAFSTAGLLKLETHDEEHAPN